MIAKNDLFDRKKKPVKIQPILACGEVIKKWLKKA
jgi:hypothetical protein